MQKIKTEDFEKELREIDPRLTIRPNANRVGASNVFLNGVDICPWLPQFEMQDEATPDYIYHLNGMVIPLKTTEQVKEIVRNVLGKIEDKEFSDALFNMPVDAKEETYGDHKA